MTEAKIFCDADCKYNNGHCTHPDKQYIALYGGIDRYYVEKCDLFEASNEKGGAE